ncbi:DUF1176 domain-containing protein [Pseudoalteromonas sp. MM17-2]|uniref:DUF1176 domain-containing protein n=1 Tax=Pseudoalteromonas sp. MM17-2 TaxID=2917753 RepID=UPI001EF4541D|nr:DUF1176 domain-containing protein [Pseudoalteromonas sp. MM17-2]MCG7544250.1 DUF1176 domain-containing protein [Pseudoalteromonas sp. MM17-2]
MKDLIRCLFFYVLLGQSLLANEQGAELSWQETRAQWKRLIQWPDRCDENMEPYLEVELLHGYSVHRWWDERLLAIVTCAMEGNNFGELLYLETTKNSGKFNLLSFPQFKTADRASGNIERVISGKLDVAPYYRFHQSLLWGNIRRDLAGGSIVNTYKYRGLGDCGVLTAYEINGDQIQLASLQIKDDCHGPWLASESWPLIDEAEYMTWPVVVLKERVRTIAN